MDNNDDAKGGNGDYTFVRLTNREVYAEVMATKEMVRDIKADVKELVALKDRVGKLESRFNGVIVGLGTGILVGAVALLRGMIGT